MSYPRFLCLPEKGEIHNAHIRPGFVCARPLRLNGSVRPVRCVFPHPAGPTALPAGHGVSGAFSFRCAPLWPHQCPSVFTKVMAMVAAHLRRSGVPVFPLPRRLTAEGGLAPGSHHPLPDYGGPPNIVWVHYKCAEVAPDSITATPFHWSHSVKSAILRLPSGESRTFGLWS